MKTTAVNEKTYINATVNMEAGRPALDGHHHARRDETLLPVLIASQ
jgi:hypothetical protein